MQTAGPVALAEAIADYSRQHDTSVTVLPPGTIYPYNWLLVSRYVMRMWQLSALLALGPVPSDPCSHRGPDCGLELW